MRYWSFSKTTFFIFWKIHSFSKKRTKSFMKNQNRSNSFGTFFLFFSFVLENYRFFISLVIHRSFFLNDAIVQEKLFSFSNISFVHKNDALLYQRCLFRPFIFNLNWTTVKQETCSPREWHRLCAQHQDLNGN